MVEKYTSVNFFRIFGANAGFLTLKTWFSSFIFFQAQISSKNSEKFIIRHGRTIHFCKSLCSLVRSLKFQMYIVVIETSLLHPTKNFKDFSETHVDSENSEKMHGYV